MSQFIPPYGTQAELENVTLDDGEMVYDTTNKVIRVGDGITPGGILPPGLAALVSSLGAGLMSVPDKNRLDYLAGLTAMPVASADNLGYVVRYMGTTNTYNNGIFYQCQYVDETYSWVEIDMNKYHNADAAAHAAAFAVQLAAHNANTAVHAEAIANALPHVCQGRLTLVSGGPVPVDDVSNASTLYLTPYGGNKIMLYNGVMWMPRTFDEISLDLAPDGEELAANTNFDIFAYWDDETTTVALEAVAWAGNVNRTTAIICQKGIKVKSDNPTRLYIGTIRTTATAGKTSNSSIQRFVWNNYNQTPTLLQTYNTNTSFTWYDTTDVEFNAGAGQVRGEFVSGDYFSITDSQQAFYATYWASLWGRVINGDLIENFNNTAYMASGAPSAVRSWVVDGIIGYGYISQFHSGCQTTTIYSTAEYGCSITFNC